MGMENKTFYRAIIFILILLNLGSIGFIYRGSKCHPPHLGKHEGPKNLIIERLGFDDAQQKKYVVYIKVHQKQIRAAQDQRVVLKNKLYVLLTQSTIDTTKRDSLMQLITDNHQKVEEIHFNHFEEIKSLCKGEEQLKKFDHLSLEFSRFFAAPMRRK